MSGESVVETMSGKSDVETMSGELDEEVTKASSVFWDLVDLPIPLGVCPFAVHLNVQLALRNKGLEVDWLSFYLYVHKQKQRFSDDMVELFDDAGMTFLPEIPEGKLERVNTMFRDIHLWALDNPLSETEPVGNLMVVSRNLSEPEFVQRLEALKSRGYNILLVQPKELASPVTVPTETLDWLWTTMLRDPIEPISACAHCGNFKSRESPKFQRTAVFWDLVDYPIPADVDFCTATKNIESALLAAKGFYGYFSFLFYFEKQPLPDEKLKLYNDANKLFFFPLGDKFTRVNRMLLDILLWAMYYRDYETKINVMLVSKNISVEPEFVHVLEALKSRWYNVHSFFTLRKCHRFRLYPQIGFGKTYSVEIILVLIAEAALRETKVK